VPQICLSAQFDANTFLVSAPTPDKPPILALLASNLLAARARGNWTPRALAEQAQVTRRMIQLVELGDVNASLKTVDRLARALGVTTASLLGARPVARQETSSVIEEVLAQNLVSARKRLDLTQEALALRSGVSRFVIAHIERQARNPSLLTLAKLAASLDLSLETLLSDAPSGH
jgi:transcriptional regulator with XRE-family HTH domain